MLRLRESRLVSGQGRTEDAAVDDDEIRRIVKDKYGRAALAVVSGRAASCSSSACCDDAAGADPITTVRARKPPPA